MSTPPSPRPLKTMIAATNPIPRRRPHLSIGIRVGRATAATGHGIIEP
jgi:hypothetical protein